MSVIESQIQSGYLNKTECDFCDEKPENGVLIEKPHSMIIKGQLILSERPRPLHICLECLNFEIENIAD